MIEFIQCFILIGIIAFTNTGGLGGAGILVPVNMGLYRFDTRNAIALSNFATPWSAIVRYVSHFREPHPLRDGKGIMIDYNVSTLIIPSAIVGATIGSIINIMMPGPVMLALFILSSFAMVYQALKKYCGLLKSERRQQPSSGQQYDNTTKAPSTSSSEKLAKMMHSTSTLKRSQFSTSCLSS